MLKPCPDLVEVQDIQFKLHCRLKVSDTISLEGPKTAQSLISCASRYGLLFVGHNTPNLQVIQLKCIENYTTKDKDITNYPRRNIPLPSRASHISVNCDSTILAVVVEKDKCVIVIFYDVLSFYKQNIVVVKEIRLSATPGISVIEIGWNPALPTLFTACKSDGSLGIYEIKGDSVEINEIPPAAETSCFCWSPKGKQIAVGSKSGQITQYKPDLKPVKIIAAPPLEGKHSLISLQWISNFQFIGVYQSLQEDGQAKLVVVDAPKSGETGYTNYDDVCYSGNGRPPQFFMILQQHWNLLMVASSNSAELATLGYTSDLWKQYIIGDAARAELPLNSGEDTFPVGLALDISNTKPLPWGESTIPPCPYILMLSHAGILCIFNVVNLKAGIPTICTPPDAVADLSGLGQFNAEAVKVAEKVPDQIAPSAQVTTSALPFISTTVTPQRPLFGQPRTQASLFGQSSNPLFGTTQEQIPSFGSGTASSTLSASQPVTSATSFFGSQATKPLFGFSQPQTTATPTLFGSKTTTAQSLFGSQITVTNVKPAPVPESTGTQAGGSEKYGSIFASLNNPTSSTETTVKKPIVVKIDSKKSQPQPIVSQPTTVQPKPVQSNVGQLKASQPKVVQPVTTQSSLPQVKPTVEDKRAEMDSLIAKMVREECLALDSELKALLHQSKNIDVNIGTDEQKNYIASEIEELQEFIDEIVDVSLGENAEVHSLKQNLILSWAWYEEAQMHYNTSKDETMLLLLRSQPLDSATEKRQTDMRKLMYYIESQLMQAGRALDEQWDRFQDYAKKTYRVQMPTMESIFQTMVRQNAIIQKQCYILKDISNRLRHKARTFAGPPLLLSIENTTDLEEDLKRLQIDQDSSQRPLYEKALKQSKAMTKTKSGKLRKLLKNRDVGHVTAIKPELSTSILQTPAAKSKMISILGAQMSPVQKQGIPRTLEFIQSTPINNHKAEPTKVPPNTPALLETRKEFVYKTTENSVSTTTVAFQMLPSSVPVISNKASAFAPATQGTKTFNFTSVASTETQNVPVAKTTPLQLFNLGGNTANASAPDKVERTNASPPMSSKPVSFPTTFSFTNTPSSDKVVTTKPTPLFANTATKPSLLATPTSAQFGNTSITSISSPSMVPAKPESSKSPANFGIATSTSIFGTPSSSTSVQFGIASTSTPLFGSAPTIKNPVATNLAAVSTAAPNETPKPFSGLSSTFGMTQNVTSSNPTTISIFGTIPTTTTIVASSSASNKVTIVASTSCSTVFGSLSESSGSSATSSSADTVKVPFSGTKLPSATTLSTVITSTSVPSASVTSIPVATPASFPSATSVVPSIPAIVTLSEVTSSSTSPALDLTTSSSASTSSISALPQTTTTSSIFASSSTSTSTLAFGSTTTTGIAPIIFGPSATSVGSGTSIFASTTATTSTPPVFGSTASSTVTTSTTALPAFSSSSSIFGSSMPVATQSSIFGTASTGKSIFGGAVSQPVVFGSTTTQSSIFGNAPTTTTATSVFGNEPTTQGSIFGTPVTQNSIFGSPSTTQASIFGATGSTATKSSIFGTPNPNAFVTPAFGPQTQVFSIPQTTASTFGSSPFGGGGTNVFVSTPTTKASVFGQPAELGQGTSPMFGTSTTASSPFGSATNSSTFGSVSSSTNAFGGTAPSSSFSFANAGNKGNTGSFGFGGLNVGNTTTTNSSIFGGGSAFGQQTTVANPFSRTETKPAAFGSSGGSIFGDGITSSSTSIFGSNTDSAFGGATTSTGFGSPNAFGQQSSPFGQSTFGSTTQPGPFSGGGTGVGQTGFGSPSTFQKSASGFGSAPVFGGSPQQAFGASPTFGGSPAFGAAPAFGSPTKIFGSNTPTAAFGGSTTGSPGFGNIANQNTIGFGNLAQQASTSASSPFAGNSSFSTWR